MRSSTCSRSKAKWDQLVPLVDFVQLTRFLRDLLGVEKASPIPITWWHIPNEHTQHVVLLLRLSDRGLSSIVIIGEIVPSIIVGTVVIECRYR